MSVVQINKDNCKEVTSSYMKNIYKIFLDNYNLTERFINSIDELKLLDDDLIKIFIIKRRNIFDNKLKYNLFKKNNKEICDKLYENNCFCIVQATNSVKQAFKDNIEKKDRIKHLNNLHNFYKRMDFLELEKVYLNQPTELVTLELKQGENFITDGKIVSRNIVNKLGFYGNEKGAKVVVENPGYIISKERSRYTVTGEYCYLYNVDLFSQYPNTDNLPYTKEELFKENDKVMQELQIEENYQKLSKEFEELQSDEFYLRKRIMNLLKLSEKLGVSDKLFDSMDDVDINTLLNKKELNALKKIIIGDFKIEKSDINKEKPKTNKK